MSNLLFFLAIGIYDRLFETTLVAIIGISSDTNVLLDSLHKRFEQVRDKWLVATDTRTRYSGLIFHQLGIIQIPTEQPELIMYLSALKADVKDDEDTSKITLAQIICEIENYSSNPPILPRI